MIFLLACHAGWTDAAALAAHRARLDQNQDGRITEEEYKKTLWNGPPFASADGDGDGDLSVAEWLNLVRFQSAASFDGPSNSDTVKQSGGGVVLPPVEQRDLAELLGWMGDALQSVGQPGPDPVALRQAVQSGRLDSAETQAVLESLRAPWQAQGWIWPFP